MNNSDTALGAAQQERLPLTAQLYPMIDLEGMFFLPGVTQRASHTGLTEFIPFAFLLESRSAASQLALIGIIHKGSRYGDWLRVMQLFHWINRLCRGACPRIDGRAQCALSKWIPLNSYDESL